MKRTCQFETTVRQVSNFEGNKRRNQSLSPFLTRTGPYVNSLRKLLPKRSQQPKLAQTNQMLTTLRIKNLALVSDLTLELQPGFNAITGETGAGKSIIIGALNLVLGERADRALIRSGSDSCSVEAVFDTTRIRTLCIY